MPIARMKKLQAFTHKNDVDILVRKLIKMRCLEIETVNPEDYTEEKGEALLKKPTVSISKPQIEASIARINDSLVSLHKYDERKHGLFGHKIEVDLDEFVLSEDYSAAWDTVNETENIQKRLNKIKTELADMHNYKNSLYMWLDYDLPISFDGTRSTRVLTGCIPSETKIDEFVKNFENYMVEFEVVSQDKTGIYLSVIVHNDEFDDVLRQLNSYGFIRIAFNNAAKNARFEYSEASLKFEKLEKERDTLDERLHDLTEFIDKVEILYDYERTAQGSLNCKQKLMETEETVMFTGWIPEDKQIAVESLLESYNCAYEMADPEKGEDAPILLKNNKFARNFEWVLTMYSYPKYGRFDPTFLMSIFFTIIFGVMFADVGYGAMLIIGGFGAVFVFKPRGGMKDFLTMFGICGVSALIMGVLFGGYFGDMPVVIMQKYMGVANPPNMALAFNPIDNVILFIAISLAIGAVHMFVGMGIKFYMICKDSTVLDAFFDVGSYWVLFVGLGLLAVNSTAAMAVSVCGVLLLLLTQGRNEKKIGAKIGKGFASLYALAGYASDLLSYMRIMALGLASSIIAQVVNVLGSMSDSVVGGIIGMTIAFLVGHTLNFGLNALGTFVHTSRLQYIEFFNKFFEDGGRKFEPLSPSDEYSVQTVEINK